MCSIPMWDRLLFSFSFTVCYLAVMLCNKESSLKAKARTKDSTLKVKDRSKDQTFKTKDRAKDQPFAYKLGCSLNC